MNSLMSYLNKVNVLLTEPIDWAEVDKVMTEFHEKLTECEWALVDESLRHECEQLLISWTTKRYQDTASPQQPKPLEEK